MARKKWTAQTEVNDNLILFRAKRKWQLSYRRYVIEKAPSLSYAHYFGLDIEMLRRWFELQFCDGLNWDNHGKAWQFDHIIPASYFDFSNENDLKLCWSFINMRVEKLDLNKDSRNRIDLLAVRPYFQDLFNKTGFSLCLKMLEKIEYIELSNNDNPAIECFIIENKELLEQVCGFTQDEFNRLNEGMTVKEVLLEGEILRKFGSGQKP